MNEAAADAIEAAAAEKVQANEEFEIAKKAVIEAYSHFLEAKKHLKNAALAAGLEFKESASQYLGETMTKVRDKKEAVADSTSGYVKENPLTSVGIAFISGMIFSRMFGK